MKSSLKREGLRFEGIKNDKDGLENEITELKRSNADLKRQVEKWQGLENKEGTETEKLRKQRIDLEVRLRELEARLSEKEQSITEEMKLKEAKIERFRTRLQEYVVRFSSQHVLRPPPEFRIFYFPSRPLTRSLGNLSLGWKIPVKNSNNRLPHSQRRTSSSRPSCPPQRQRSRFVVRLNETIV